MNLIFFSRRRGLAQHLRISHPVVLSVAGVLGLGILGSVFALGMQFGSHGVDRQAQLAELDQVRQQVQDRLDAVSARMGELNAHVVRLDALGKRLTDMAKINSGEFNFDTTPALGGPEDDLASTGGSAVLPDISRLIDEMQRRLEQRDS